METVPSPSIAMAFSVSVVPPAVSELEHAKRSAIGANSNIFGKIAIT
jgi:hypothetical protein